VALKLFLKQLSEVDDWAKADIKAVAEALSPSTGIPVPILNSRCSARATGSASSMRPPSPSSSASPTRFTRSACCPSRSASRAPSGRPRHEHRPDDRANILWFLPTHGDGRYLGTATGGRQTDFAYLRQIAQAADTLGYYGVLLPTGRSCEDSWIVASAVAPLTQNLRYLVAVRPGLQSPTVAARMTATLDRLSNGRLLVNVVTGGDPVENAGDGIFLDHDERYEVTRSS
jgi:hypothetical protein